MEIFRLFGSIFVNTDAAEKSIQKIEKAAEALGNGMVKVGDKVSGIGGMLTKTITTGVAALGIASAKSASTFEDALAKVSTIADESEMSMDEMRKAILDLSDQTGISASAIAEDVYNAISAGQKTADAVNFVSNSTKLAKSGFAETGQSLDILTTILNAYGMEAKDVTKVSDILIQTQNLGKTTVADLASSMGKVIPTAKAQGVELDTLCSAYAVMTANGIATAETTTYLNSMLNELGKQGTSASKAFAEGTEHIKEGGLTMAEAMEQGWSLADVLSILDEQACISGTSIANMFGSAEAGKAASVLWDKAEQLNGVFEKMEGSAGATENAFQKLETTSYKVQKAFNEAKNVLIDLGGTIIEMLVPYLEKGVEKVHEFAEWFKGLDDNTKETIVKIGLLVAAIGPLLTVFGKGISVVGNIINIGSKLIGGIGNIIKIGGGLASGITKVIGVFSGAASFVTGTLIPAISAIGAPVLIVIGVITALIAIGVLLYQNWDEIKEWAGKTWGKIKDIVGGAIEKIRGFFSGIIDFVRDNWQGLLLFLVNPFVGGFKLLYDNCEQFRNFIDGFLEKLKSLISGAAEKIKGFFSGIIDFVRNNWQGLLLFLVNPFVGAFKLLYDNCEQFRNFIDGFFGKIKERFQNFISGMGQKASEFKNKVVETAGELKDKVVNRFQELKEGAVSKFNELKENATARFGELKEKVSSEAQELKEKTVARFQELKEKTEAKVSELKEKVTSKVSELKENAVSNFHELKEKAGEKISSLKDRAVEAFDGIREKGLAGFENLKSGALEKFEHLKAGISEKLDAVKNFVSNAVQKLKDFFKFDWQLPKIKLPHFTIDGSFSLNPPSIPKFGIDWYKDGGIMTKPTAFGINPDSGKVMAGGEAGPEAIAPIELLKQYVREAVEERDERLYEVLNAILVLLREWLPKCPGGPVVLDSGALVGELAAPLNEKLGWMTHTRGRCN